MYRRLSTETRKIKANVHIINLHAKLDEHAAFMIRLKRNSNSHHTTVKWPKDGLVEFDEVISLDITLFCKKPGIYLPKQCEIQVICNGSEEAGAGDLFGKIEIDLSQPFEPKHFLLKKCVDHHAVLQLSVELEGLEEFEQQQRGRRKSRDDGDNRKQESESLSPRRRRFSFGSNRRPSAASSLSPKANNRNQSASPPPDILPEPALWSQGAISSKAPPAIDLSLSPPSASSSSTWPTITSPSSSTQSTPQSPLSLPNPPPSDMIGVPGITDMLLENMNLSLSQKLTILVDLWILGGYGDIETHEAIESFALAKARILTQKHECFDSSVIIPIKAIDLLEKVKQNNKKLGPVKTLLLAEKEKSKYVFNSTFHHCHFNDGTLGLGIFMPKASPAICITRVEGQAIDAGVQTGDEVFKVGETLIARGDGKESLVAKFKQLVQLHDHNHQPLIITMRRYSIHELENDENNEYDDDEVKENEYQLKFEFGSGELGIGMFVNKADQRIHITRVSGQSEALGMEPGDMVLSVNGEHLHGDGIRFKDLVLTHNHDHQPLILVVSRLRDKSNAFVPPPLSPIIASSPKMVMTALPEHDVEDDSSRQSKQDKLTDDDDDGDDDDGDEGVLFLSPETKTFPRSGKKSPRGGSPRGGSPSSSDGFMSAEEGESPRRPTKQFLIFGKDPQNTSLDQLNENDDDDLTVDGDDDDVVALPESSAFTTAKEVASAAWANKTTTNMKKKKKQEEEEEVQNNHSMMNYAEFDLELFDVDMYFFGEEEKQTLLIENISKRLKLKNYNNNDQDKNHNAYVTITNVQKSQDNENGTIISCSIFGIKDEFQGEYITGIIASSSVGVSPPMVSEEDFGQSFALGDSIKFHNRDEEKLKEDDKGRITRAVSLPPRPQVSPPTKPPSAPQRRGSMPNGMPLPPKQIPKSSSSPPSSLPMNGPENDNGDLEGELLCTSILSAGWEEMGEPFKASPRYDNMIDNNDPNRLAKLDALINKTTNKEDEEDLNTNDINNDAAIFRQNIDDWDVGALQTVEGMSSPDKCFVDKDEEKEKEVEEEDDDDDEDRVHSRNILNGSFSESRTRTSSADSRMQARFLHQQQQSRSQQRRTLSGDIQTKTTSSTFDDKTREEIKAELLQAVRAEVSDAVRSAMFQALNPQALTSSIQESTRVSSPLSDSTPVVPPLGDPSAYETMDGAVRVATDAAIQAISSSGSQLGLTLRPTLENAVRSAMMQCLATNNAAKIQDTTSSTIVPATIDGVNSPSNTSRRSPSPLSTPATSPNHPLHDMSFPPIDQPKEDAFAMLEQTHGVLVANAAREAAQRTRPLLPDEETKNSSGHREHFYEEDEDKVNSNQNKNQHIVVVLPPEESNKLDGSPDMSKAMVMNSDGTAAPPHMIELAKRALLKQANSSSPPLKYSQSARSASFPENRFTSTSHFIAPVTAVANKNGSDHQDHLLRSAPAVFGRRSATLLNEEEEGFKDEDLEHLKDQTNESVMFAEDGVDINGHHSLNRLDRRLFEMRGGGSDVATLGSREEDTDDDGVGYDHQQQFQSNSQPRKAPAKQLNSSNQQQIRNMVGRGGRDDHSTNTAAAVAASHALEVMEKAEQRVMEADTAAMMAELRLAEAEKQAAMQSHYPYHFPNNTRQSEISLGLSPLTTSPGNSITGQHHFHTQAYATSSSTPLSHAQYPIPNTADAETISKVIGARNTHSYSPSPLLEMQRKTHEGVSMSVTSQEFKADGWAGLSPRKSTLSPNSAQPQYYHGQSQPQHEQPSSPVSPQSSVGGRGVSEGVRVSQEALHAVQRALHEDTARDYTKPPPPPPPPSQQQQSQSIDSTRSSPVTPALDPTALSKMKPAIALATTFLNLRQNVIQFRYALASELAAMAKDLERCSKSPGSVIREFKDGHLKVQQAVVMMVPNRSMVNGCWRINGSQMASAPDFQQVQVLSGLRKMVVAFDQASEAQRAQILNMPAVVNNLDKLDMMGRTCALWAQDRFESQQRNRLVVPGISHKVDQTGPRISVPSNLGSLYDTLTAEPKPVELPPPQHAAQQTLPSAMGIPTTLNTPSSSVNDLSTVQPDTDVSIDPMVLDPSFRTQNGTDGTLSTAAISPFLHGVVSPELADTMRLQANQMRKLQESQQAEVETLIKQQQEARALETMRLHHAALDRERVAEQNKAKILTQNPNRKKQGSSGGGTKKSASRAWR